MDTENSRCPPSQIRKDNGHCLSNVFNRMRQKFSNASFSKDESGNGPVKQLVLSIEREPLRQESNGEQGITYRVIEEQQYNQNACIPWHNKGLIFALALTFLSLGVNYVLWLTSAYDNAILKLVSIRDDLDMVFDLWRMPPTRPTLSVYLFNYTNHEAILNGSEMPKVQEVGPIVFRERMERINIHFNNNGTVSFQEKKTIDFVPERTNVSLMENIYTPHVILLTMLAKASKFNFLEQTFFSNQFMDSSPFAFVSINDTIWGYKDNDLLKIIKFVEFLGESISVFGFLLSRQGVHHDIITMNTGIESLSNAGLITRWNGNGKTNVWTNTTCDEIEASDGTLFPAELVNGKKPLYIYSHGMCRRLPLVFHALKSSKDGLPVHEYNIKNSAFQYDKEENRCYNLKGSYPPNGVFYNGPCIPNDPPMYISFPHFWTGEKSLFDDISGLDPSAEKHKSYFHIHKDLGISLLANTKIQVSIEINRPTFMKMAKHLKKEKIILPIGWLHYDSGELPADFVTTIYHLTYTVKTVKSILQWSFLTILFILLFTVFVIIKKYIVR